MLTRYFVDLKGKVHALNEEKWRELALLQPHFGLAEEIRLEHARHNLFIEEIWCTRKLTGWRALAQKLILNIWTLHNKLYN